MTTFPCSRCGGRPEILPGEATAVILRHKCLRGRPRETVFAGPSRDENTRDAIYIWNENNARDNPAWWPERYDYLRRTCKAARRVEE